MKLTTSDAHTGADLVPELCQVDFHQQSAGVIQDSLVRHADSASQHLVHKTKRPESTKAVAREVQAGAAHWPRFSTLNDFRNEPLLAERSAERETRDSAADYQDA
jgi:hypothetical protein